MEDAWCSREGLGIYGWGVGCYREDDGHFRKDDGIYRRMSATPSCDSVIFLSLERSVDQQN